MLGEGILTSFNEQTTSTLFKACWPLKSAAGTYCRTHGCMTACDLTALCLLWSRIVIKSVFLLIVYRLYKQGQERLGMVNRCRSETPKPVFWISAFLHAGPHTLDSVPEAIGVLTFFFLLSLSSCLNPAYLAVFVFLLFVLGSLCPPGLMIRYYNQPAKQ